MDNELEEIEEMVAAGTGMSLPEIHDQLSIPLTHRQLLYRVNKLVEQGRIRAEGERRWRRYFPLSPGDSARPEVESASEIFSPEAAQALESVGRPLSTRKPVGYDVGLLDDYAPNETFLLEESVRARLEALCAPTESTHPAGTYARQILERLLIDLSWASSHLEGNTYSLLDTKRLIEEGREAEGKERSETQMILNHKRAIEFLVEDAAGLGAQARVITNLHATLTENLLADPSQGGKIRSEPVGVSLSVYHPISVPQRLRELFYRILPLARSVEDPLEQSFFLFVHLAYLQPFIDGNKRTVRLAANIPLIEANYRPLTFVEVPRDDYLRATLALYETTRIEPLRDLYVWAYERSCARYESVSEHAAEPDPFRLEHRDLIYEAVRRVISTQESDPEPLVEKMGSEHFDDLALRAKFVGMVLTDVDQLHEGNFMRYRIRPGEFEAWMADHPA